MWQGIIVVGMIGAAAAYVTRSLVRSWRGKQCGCRTKDCVLADMKANAAEQDRQDLLQVISPESLADPARKLRSSGITDKSKQPTSHQTDQAK